VLQLFGNGIALGALRWIGIESLTFSKAKDRGIMLPGLFALTARAAAMIPLLCSVAISLSRQANGDQSDIFEISTRHLPDHFSSIDFQNPNVEVNKWQGNGWRRSSVEHALPATNTDTLTILYVHGNFMERNNSLDRVRIIDGYLRQQTDQPYRLLMLSWPSQRERKPLRDVFDNAESAECQALYVSWILHRLHQETQVSLMSFSFGARAVTGGLHLNAGGSIPGFCPTPTIDDGISSKYRVGLVAPAIDRDWIAPNGRHGLAVTQVDSLVNLYNSRDPVLRRFRFLDRFGRPIAAGFSGFVGFNGLESFSNPRATSPLSGQSSIRQYDCGTIIGNTHSEKSYYGECPYFRLMIQHLLWKETGESNFNACVVP
jgi:hypothetical protein